MCRKREKNRTEKEKKGKNGDKIKWKKEEKEEENKKNWRIVKFKRFNPYVFVKLCDSFILCYN